MSALSLTAALPPVPAGRRLSSVLWPFSTLRQQGLLECGRPMGAEGYLSQATLVQAWQRCRENPASNAAWEDLLRRLLPCFSKIISRAAWGWRPHDRADVDDVVQDLCLKICQLVKSGASLPTEEAALEAYFKAMAANAARDWIRRRRAEKRNQDVTVPIEDHLDELVERTGGAHALERAVLLQQIKDRLKGSPRDVAVFLLYYRQGFSAAEIAAIPAVDLTVKGVESLIRRIAADLREGLR